jgi:hypothetical protein
MKRFCLLTTVTVAFCIVSMAVLASVSEATKPPVIGTIQPVSNERISILVGDKANINLGTRDGLIKGDIGIVQEGQDMNSEKNIGRCVITRTDFGTSICELIIGKKEIEKGNHIIFERIDYADPFIYSIVMNTLANIVEPYEPYKDLRVCLYGVFDKGNAVTELSQQILSEFSKIFFQKKRIKLVDKNAFPDLVIYPGISPDIEAYLKTQLKRANADILILSQYSVQEGKVKVVVESIDVNKYDSKTTYVFPFNEKYQKSNSVVVLNPGEVTKIRNIPCKLVLKNIPKILPREDRLFLIKSEADGNALTENALKRIDFNIVRPVEVKVVVDGESIDISDTRYHSIMLSTGNHSMSVSLKRGYFFNETLLYTSEKALQKDTVVSLSKPSDVIIEVSDNSLDNKDPIVLSVFHPIERQKQVLRPIFRVELDKTVEIFKD